MLVSKFKVTAVILIAVGALSSGVGLCAYQDIASGASSQTVGSGPVPGVPPATSQASGDSSMRSAEKLVVYAAQMEQLVRRARQEQAAGDWDGAARDLRKSVDVAGEWQEEFMNGRRREMSTRCVRCLPFDSDGSRREGCTCRRGNRRRHQPPRALPNVGSPTSRAKSIESSTPWRKTGMITDRPKSASRTKNRWNNSGEI